MNESKQQTKWRTEHLPLQSQYMCSVYYRSISYIYIDILVYIDMCASVCAWPGLLKNYTIRFFNWKPPSMAFKSPAILDAFSHKMNWSGGAKFSRGHWGAHSLIIRPRSISNWSVCVCVCSSWSSCDSKMFVSLNWWTNKLSFFHIFFSCFLCTGLNLLKIVHSKDGILIKYRLILKSDFFFYIKLWGGKNNS